MKVWVETFNPGGFSGKVFSSKENVVHYWTKACGLNPCEIGEIDEVGESTAFDGRLSVPMKAQPGLRRTREAVEVEVDEYYTRQQKEDPKDD